MALDKCMCQRSLRADDERETATQTAAFKESCLALWGRDRTDAGPPVALQTDRRRAEHINVGSGSKGRTAVPALTLASWGPQIDHLTD